MKRALMVVFACGLPVLALPQSKGMVEWEKFPFDKQIADRAKLSKLSEGQLKYMRGIVFGKHGRVFSEPFIQQYLVKRVWYKPDPKYRVEVLNGVERQNMDLIKEAEFRKHKYLEPGDMKFYRNTYLKPIQLRKYKGAEWRIMRAEIEAIHGKRFADEPWVQAFFSERYWYKPVRKYDPKQLSVFERANLNLLTQTWKKQSGLRISPCDIELFRDKRITSDMLNDVGLYELRIMRNEFYARRGHEFSSAWIQDYFNDLSWYEIKESPEPLSRIENQNVAAILKRETELHESLSKKLIDRRLLNDLFLEDARKLRYEIYARRGKVFKERWLRGYFESFAWYKPNPSFNDSELSRVERSNVAKILAYEKKILPSMNSMAA